MGLQRSEVQILSPRPFQTTQRCLPRRVFVVGEGTGGPIHSVDGEPVGSPFAAQTHCRAHGDDVAASHLHALEPDLYRSLRDILGFEQDPGRRLTT